METVIYITVRNSDETKFGEAGPPAGRPYTLYSRTAVSRDVVTHEC
jgi:hypothetical protein